MVPLLPVFEHWQEEFKAQFTTSTTQIISSFFEFQMAQYGYHRCCDSGRLTARWLHCARPNPIQPRTAACSPPGEAVECADLVNKVRLSETPLILKGAQPTAHISESGESGEHGCFCSAPASLSDRRASVSLGV